MVVDAGTGEVVGGKFAKMFFDDISSLFGLTGTERAILDCMVRDSKLGGSNVINMTPKKKKEIAKEIGLKTYRSVSNCLISMAKYGVIKDNRQDDVPYKWMLNPNIFFKGNDYQRAKLLIEYSSGKRNVMVFKDSDDANIYFAEQESAKEVIEDIEKNRNDIDEGVIQEKVNKLKENFGGQK